MKHLFLSLLIFSVSICFAQHEHKNSGTSSDTLKKSIAKEVHIQIGDAHMMLKYHAPAVRGRTIWGGLVPYGEVWVTGAHSATSWEFSRDIVINSKKIPAGKYAIFTIPNKENWTIILNKKWEQHLADDYDAKDDIIRVEVTPSNIENQERLLYRIEQKETGGEIQISWEKKKVVLPFKLSK